MRLPHVVPFRRSPLYFFTACTHGRRALLANRDAFEILQEIWCQAAEKNGWHVGRFVLMPDHVHFFAKAVPDALDRGAWHKLWKGLSSRYLTRALGASPPIWQEDTFDHLLRNAESYQEKWNYVRENPVRAGFCSDGEAWPWQGEIHSLLWK